MFMISRDESLDIMQSCVAKEREDDGLDDEIPRPKPALDSEALRSL